uniref:hypothetical protein n=1 Tax=Trichocoleus desertorum TaxID=1481672 RepID=UPI0025B5666B|nr:hypothetical protein [Trichocoleus desertorum]
MSDFVIQVLPEPTIIEIAEIGVQGPPGFDAVWGTIAGTLSSQSDLQAALDSKESLGAAASAIASHLTSTPHLTSAEVQALIDGGNFAPAVHQHAITDIANLQPALSSKENVGAASAAVTAHEAAYPHADFVTDAELSAAIASRISSAEKGAVNGVATLDTNGKVPTTQLPEFGAVQSVFGRTGVVAAESGDYNSDQIAEGVANLYYTQARSRASLSTTGPLAYDLATGAFSLPAASGTQDGYFSSANFTKLSGIQAGATANSADTFLRNRANHEGSQSVSTITGLGTAATLDNTTATWNANQLQGRAIATTAPTDLQSLRWNNSLSQWEPQTATVLSANITDATATGRSVLTAADTTAARAAIGAPVKPASSTLNAIARYSDTVGNLSNSLATVDGLGNLRAATGYGGAVAALKRNVAGTEFTGLELVGFFGGTFGIVSDNSGFLGFYSGGTELVSISSGGLLSVKRIKPSQPGSVFAPSFSFDDTTLQETGLYLPAVGELGIVASRTEVIRCRSTGVTIAGTLRIGNYTTATLPAAGTAGRLAYATDARWSGGTGCEVRDNGTYWATPDACQASTTGFINTFTASQTLDRTHRTAYYNSSSAGTFTLPSASVNLGRMYFIKQFGTGALAIAAATGEQIEGASSVTLTQGNAVMIQSNGTDWRIL